MEKIKQLYFNSYEYLKSLSSDIKIIYTLSCIFFIVEYGFSIIKFGIYKHPYADFEWLFPALLPIFYIALNAVLILVKKINAVSLTILFYLRVLQPSTLTLVMLVAIGCYDEIIGFGLFV